MTTKDTNKSIHIKLTEDEHKALLAAIDAHNRTNPTITVTGLGRWLFAQWAAGSVAASVPSARQEGGNDV